MSYVDLLESEFEKFEVGLPLDQKILLGKYCEELERWNQKINLTGLCDRELVRRLVVEPAWFRRELGIGGSLADIGSGNGSPGIPLHILGGLGR